MSDTTQVNEPAKLTRPQKETLQSLADLMIPADEGFDVPGAGDERIFTDIQKSMARSHGYFLEVATKLDELSDGPFQSLGEEEQSKIFSRLQAEAPTAFKFMARTILQCYYRDDRVMRSLGMEVRPPFPRGFEVEQGDWSLLDPVRARAPFYRKIS